MAETRRRTNHCSRLGRWRRPIQRTRSRVPQSAEQLAVAGKSQVPVEAILRVPPSTSFERLQRAIRVVRGACIATVRLPGSDPR